MTVTPHGESSVKSYVSTDDNLGFEDVDSSDLAMPRLKIIGADAVFEDSLSGARFESLEVILLGLVKGRIMWDETVDEGDKPMCKSPDFASGFPNVSEQTPRDKRFPWRESNFEPNDFPANNGINNLVTLPCDSCAFKEWGKSDSGKSVPPKCKEQHVYPLVYKDESGNFNPAILTLQSSGIKPSKSYLSTFARTKTPMFTCHTTLTLQSMSRGSVKYAVPVFRKGSPTDQDDWNDYADLYRGTRDFLRTPPRNPDEDGSGAAPSAPSANVNTAPAGAPQTVASTVVAPPPTVTAPEPTAAPVAVPSATPAPAPAFDDPWATGPSGQPAAAPVDEDDFPF